ncbi:MAG: hypothetical protein ABFD69_04550 [Candidatus Sumerlaeia bacterium]
MAKPAFRYWYEWRCDNPLWADNDEARDFLGDSAQGDLEALGFSKELIDEIRKTGEWHDSYLNWESPIDPGPWRQNECDRFNKKAREIYERIVQEANGRFDVIYDEAEHREDPDLDEYLKDPDHFRRKDDPREPASNPPKTGWLGALRNFFGF